MIPKIEELSKKLQKVHSGSKLCRTINGLRESLSSDATQGSKLSLDPLLVDKVMLYDEAMIEQINVKDAGLRNTAKDEKNVNEDDNDEI